MHPNATAADESTDREPLPDFADFRRDPVRDVCRAATLNGPGIHFEGFEDIDEWGPGLALLVDSTEAVVRREVA